MKIKLMISKVRAPHPCTLYEGTVKGAKALAGRLGLFSHLDNTPSSVAFECCSCRIDVNRFSEFGLNFQSASLFGARSNGVFTLS